MTSIPQSPDRLGIRSIPAVVAFVDGRPADVLMGAVPESEVRPFVARFSGRGSEAVLKDILAKIDVMMQQGAFADTLRLYAQILKDDPKNIPAISGLATCLFKTGEADKARALLDGAPVDNENPRIKAVLAKIELGEQVKKLGDPLVLEKRAGQNLQDYQTRLDLALVYNAQGKYAAAADTLLPSYRLTATGMMTAHANSCCSFLKYGDRKTKRPFQLSVNCLHCCLPETGIQSRFSLFPKIF